MEEREGGLNPLRYTDYSGYTWGIFKPFVQAAKWIGNNVGSVVTGVYLAAAAVTTVFCPPAGLAMFGAYLGGAQVNGWELNAGSWNWQDPMTYMGIGFGALVGYTAGYGLVHKGSVAVRFGASIAGVGEVGFSMANNDFEFSWTTVAGGGGSYKLNGHNTTPEGVVNGAIADATSGWNSMGGLDYVTGTSGTRYGLEPYNGPKVITGTPPFIGGPLRKGQQALKVGKYLFNPSAFHVAKQGLLKNLSIKGYASIVGKNPDIMLKGTKVFLTGAKNSPYFGKSYETGLSVLDFIDLFY